MTIISAPVRDVHEQDRCDDHEGLDIKMVEKLANEVSAWMVSFLRIHVCADVQLSLVVLFFGPSHRLSRQRTLMCCIIC